MFTATARRTCYALMAAGLAGALGAGSVAALPTANTPAPGESDPEAQLLLVLDASRSMEDPSDDEEPKIDAAHTALYALIDGLGDDERVGFRVFGATSDAGPGVAESCTDSQLVVPIDTGNRDDLRDAVEDFAPKAETPMGYALQEAGNDLGSDGPRSIVLVSDGRANCDPDPCEVAKGLAEDGVDLSIHAVGLNVDAEARQQLKCIADAGNGQYFDASDTESLTAAMDRLATRAFRPFSVSGTPVEGTDSTDDAPELVGGEQYTDVLGEQDQVLHYLVRRQFQGSSVHVGLSTIPPMGQHGQIGVHLRSLDGSQCGFGYDETTAGGGGEAWQMITTQATAWPNNTHRNNPCRDDEVLVLTVEMTSWQANIAGTPFEMVVIEEPAAANQPTLPARADERPQWTEMSESGAGDALEITGGSSFNDAPLLEPGTTYAGNILPGETVYFRVPVQWGQRLQAQTLFPEPGPALSDVLRDPLSAKTTLISPARGVATAIFAEGAEHSYSENMLPDRPTVMQATTTDVRWLNRSAITVEQASLAGEYYVALSMDEHLSGQSFVMPFLLTVDAVGEVDTAPEYDEVTFGGEGTEDESTGPTNGVTGGTPTTDAPPEQEDPDGDAATTTPAPEAAPSPTEDSDGVTTPVLIGLGALGLALLGSGAVALRRLRR